MTDKTSTNTGSSPETEAAPRRADAERGSEQPHRKESCDNESHDGEPGYGEAPVEVRKNRLPDQGW
jgi:hypothetical protein